MIITQSGCLTYLKIGYYKISREGKQSPSEFRVNSHLSYGMGHRQYEREEYFLWQ